MNVLPSELIRSDSIPGIQIQGPGPDERLDLILQMPTIIGVVTDVIVESTKFGRVSLRPLVF